MLAACVIATAVLTSAKTPIDCYPEEYLRECLLERRCGSIHELGYFILARQVQRGTDANGGLVITIIPPSALPFRDLDSYHTARRANR